MSIATLWRNTAHLVMQSSALRHTVFLLLILTIVLGIFLVLFLITYLLRFFFAKHPAIDKAHRVFLYIITMAGVLILFVAGLLGLVLPLIPGVVLILCALLLLRYHRSVWMDKKIRKWRVKTQFNVILEKLHLRKTGKSLKRQRASKKKRKHP